ncbi:uncharacterized protein [Phyllobates terribilis]|uniref:uncharacterized protein n=1 Tax=Phyllobates terribilis TaxID=111132 RepID=UPI003CCAC661
MEFVRNMERRRLIKPQDILATLQSIPEDESESELQEHVFDSDSDEDFIPQNISSESEDSEGTNPEDIPSTSTGDRAHAVMLPRDHPPGRGQKKSAKRPRNERTTDNDGGEGNATTNTREGESEGILVSADGIQWKPVEIGEHLPGRRDSQNILREAPGPTGYARRNIIIDSPLSAWRLFFDSYILTHIKNCTLAEACRNNNLQFTLSDEELDAFIAIFFARGISGTNRHSISSIWCNDWGIPFCKATMSRDRFVEIMRFLRFDEKSTRSERLQTDKFALFSTVWDRFIENCIACYKPGPYITVVEQLFPSKTRCPFTQYMPSKPDKYGHKYWLAVDKRSKYLANGFPYLGKDDTHRAEDRLADHVVMKLLDPFLKKGRNVTTNNYFTSVKLAKQLKSKGTTIVGTLNKIRREVPKEIKSMKEELYNTKVFRNEDNFTLTVYQGKPNKKVVILSSVHPDVVVTSDSAKKTPETYEHTSFLMAAVSKTFNEEEAAKIISLSTISTEFLKIPTSEFKRRDLEKEMKRLVSYELHAATLTEYYKEKRIPRGLRVHLRPTLFSDDLAFCDGFEQIINKCSLDLILLTIDRLQKAITDLGTEINNIETQLSTCLKVDELTALKDSLNISMDNFRKDLQERKRRKFARDTEDYLMNKVYKWRDPAFGYEKYSRTFFRSSQYSSDSGSDTSGSWNPQRPFFRRGRGRHFRRNRGEPVVITGGTTPAMTIRSQIWT